MTPEQLQSAFTTELYNAYRFFNSKFSNNSLPEPMILIQASDFAAGWFRPNSFTISDKKIPEITICFDAINGGVSEVMNTMLHEMAHLHNHENNIEDCSDKGYHNEEFKKTAENFGLTVNKVKKIGFADTELNKVGRKAVEELNPNVEVYNLYYNHFNAIKKAKEEKEKKESKLSPVIISNEVKELIKSQSDELGTTQKELTEKAVKYYLHMMMTAPDSIPADFDIIFSEK